MSRAEVENHARKYSSSYRYDLSHGRSSSLWMTNFSAMAKKTVLKQLLSKWGILSIEVSRAIQDDQKVYNASGEGVYADNQGETAEDPFTVEAPFAEEPEQSPESREAYETGTAENAQEIPDGEPEELDITAL